MMINVHEAKTQFSKLLEQAHAGQEIILAKAGKPYARLMPLAADAEHARRPGRIPEIDDRGFFEPLPDAELDAWDAPRGCCWIRMRCCGGRQTIRACKQVFVR